MKRLKSLWLLLWLPRASIDEAYDALLTMREFWRDPVDIMATTESEAVNVALNPPQVRPCFTLDIDDD